MSSKTTNVNLQGIALILIGALALSVMDAIMKLLFDDGFGVLQVLAVRSWMIVPVMTVWAWRVLPAGALHTVRPGLHFARVVLGFFAPFFFFTALKTLPLADATVIFFGATFIMTALSVPLLKERVGPHRWGAVIIGFIGVLVAAEPGGDFLHGGAVFAILSSLSYAVFMLITRWMGPGEGAYKQVLYFHVWVALVATGFSIAEFKPMTVVDVAWVALAGCVAVLGHLSLTRGFAIAPVGVVAPFEYSALIWASLLGFFVWGHVPGVSVWSGAAIIVASGLYLLYRETRAKDMQDATAGNTSEGAPPPSAVPVPPSMAQKED